MYRGMGSFHFYVSMKPSAIVKISPSACPRRREVFCECFKLETRASVWRSVLSTCSLNDNSVPIVVREENLWQKGASMERPMERLVPEAIRYLSRPFESRSTSTSDRRAVASG